MKRPSPPVRPTASGSAQLSQKASTSAPAIGAPVGGWTMIKVSNTHRDMRVDVPTIGTTTIEKLAAARAGCLVLEAGKTVILEKQKVLELADRHKIAVVGLDKAPGENGEHAG